MDIHLPPAEIRGGRARILCGASQATRWLSVEGGDGSDAYTLPPFVGGLGGIELVVSPTGMHVALMTYSGQSSQGYDLFDVSAGIRHLGGLPETHGHGDAPSFSPSGRWLVSLMDRDPIVRGEELHLEEAHDPTGEDSLVVEWASLVVQRVPETHMEIADLGVEVPRSIDPDTFHEWAVHGSLRFVGEHEVAVAMPWGEELRTSLPITSPLTTSYLRRPRS